VPLRLADLAGRRVAIWGLGVEGRAALETLPSLCDPPPVELVTVVDGEQPLSLLDGADVVVASPGVSRHRPEALALRARHRLTGGTALFLAEHGPADVVGVTGSKGKSTTTALLHHLWSALAGGPIGLGGNLGVAPLRLLADGCGPGVPVALEVSSYQATDVEVSPGIGMLTALGPDHLSWHGGFEQYVADKCNLFAHGTSHVAVAADVDERLVAGRLPGAVRYGVPTGWHAADGMIRLRELDVLPLAASPLPGAHNARNLCGVLTVLELLGLDPSGRSEDVVDALKRFRPLPFRLEPIGVVDGHEVIDDSISTNPTAAIAALASFPGRGVAIVLGGFDREIDLTDLAAAVAGRAEDTVAVCTGPVGRRLAPMLPQDRTIVAAGFDEAVRLAIDACPPGGVVVVSPGAPSFDEFGRYSERGARLRSLLGLAPPRSEL
jgi:UDP-N-acetylmuramoylalanine--D-glutamate ligase